MTTAATSLSGGGARKPSTASPPVISASFLASSGMPPPVTAMILSFSAVGSMTSGPPQPCWPRSTLTALNSLLCTTASLKLDALAPGQELGYVLRQDPADKDHDEPRKQVPDREIPEREIQPPYPLGYPEPHEQLPGVDVREEPERRVHERDRRVVERRLVLLFQKRPEGVGHRVGQEEHRQDRQHRVPREDVAGREPRGAVDPVLTDYVDQRVEERQQHDQGGYDPRYERDERLAAGLEQPDEPLARALQRAEYPALRRRSPLFLEQRDEDCIHNLSSLK